MKYFFYLINFIYRLFRKIERKTDLNLAMHGGMVIGSETRLIGKQYFGTEPYLISIGDNCLITDGVRFITHDGSIQVPLIKQGESFTNVYSKRSTFNAIKIGNNVFIGVGAIILPGTTISDNSIIAAGAVVKGSYGPDAVIAGNPAITISDVNKYLVRNKDRVVTFSVNENRKLKILNHLSK